MHGKVKMNLKIFKFTTGGRYSDFLHPVHISGITVSGWFVVIPNCWLPTLYVWWCCYCVCQYLIQPQREWWGETERQRCFTLTQCSFVSSTGFLFCVTCAIFTERRWGFRFKKHYMQEDETMAAVGLSFKSAIIWPKTKRKCISDNYWQLYLIHGQ